MELKGIKYRVERFETKTGIRLNSNNERYFQGDPDPGLHFASEEEAKKYIRANLQPGMMFYLYDSEGRLIYENVYDEIIVTPAKQKPWWKIW